MWLIHTVWFKTLSELPLPFSGQHSCRVKKFSLLQLWSPYTVDRAKATGQWSWPLFVFSSFSVGASVFLILCWSLLFWQYVCMVFLRIILIYFILLIYYYYILFPSWSFWCCVVLRSCILDTDRWANSSNLSVQIKFTFRLFAKFSSKFNSYTQYSAGK